jgi:NAD(P)H-flavin reductase
MNPIRDDVGAFDRRLTRAATLRSEASTSPQLTDLLRRVAERRARRSAAPGHAPPPERHAAATETAPSAVGGVPAPCRVGSVERVASDVRIIRVGRPPALQFRAGQYVKLGVPGQRSGSYSIASAPHDAHLEFCVELIPGGRLSPALFALKPGDRVTLADRPRGSFLLEPAVTRHLMVATVTGIAPLRSMLRDALHRGLDAEFIVLHGASHADELPYFAEMTALAAANAHVRYVPTVSRPTAARNAGWTGDTGRVDDLACRVAATLDTRHTHVYACGHPQMVRRVRGELGASFPVSTEVFD